MARLRRLFGRDRRADLARGYYGQVAAADCCSPALRVDNSRLPPLVIDRDALNSGWRMDATTWTSLIERMRNLVGLDVSKVCLFFRCVVLLLLVLKLSCG